MGQFCARDEGRWTGGVCLYVDQWPCGVSGVGWQPHHMFTVRGYALWATVLWACVTDSGLMCQGCGPMPVPQVYPWAGFAINVADHVSLCAHTHIPYKAPVQETMCHCVPMAIYPQGSCPRDHVHCVLMAKYPQDSCQRERLHIHVFGLCPCVSTCIKPGSVCPHVRETCVNVFMHINLCQYATMHT